MKYVSNNGYVYFQVMTKINMRCIIYYPKRFVCTFCTDVFDIFDWKLSPVTGKTFVAKRNKSQRLKSIIQYTSL